MLLTPLSTLPATPEIDEDPLDLMDEIERLKSEKDAVLLAHFYVDGEIQDIADFTGDSLKLARDAVKVTNSTIVFAGVHFMAESAKILNPSKKVLIPDLLAGCSLAESCPADKLAAYQRESARGRARFRNGGLHQHHRGGQEPLRLDRHQRQRPRDHRPRAGGQRDSVRSRSAPGAVPRWKSPAER